MLVDQITSGDTDRNVALMLIGSKGFQATVSLLMNFYDYRSIVDKKEIKLLNIRFSKVNDDRQEIVHSQSVINFDALVVSLQKTQPTIFKADKKISAEMPVTDKSFDEITQAGTEAINLALAMFDISDRPSNTWNSIRQS